MVAKSLPMDDPNKNLNPSTPTGGQDPTQEPQPESTDANQTFSPATPPRTPFVVAEEEETPSVPPSPTTPASPVANGTDASQQPPSPNEPPLDEPKEPETPTSNVPGNPPQPPDEYTPTYNSDEGPVIITPPQKPSPTKLIGGIVAVLLLLVSIPLGIVLIQQTQELRERAAVEPGSVGTGGVCENQADCADNLTCKDLGRGDGKRCRINSGFPGSGCCGNDSQCGQNEACNIENGTCESGLSCGAKPGSVGTGGKCTPGKTPSDCADNLTCKDGVCKINSGLQGCCGINSQCPSNDCSEANGICESGLSCKPTRPGSVGTGGKCDKQEDCADNLTCKDLGRGDGKLCRINSGFPGSGCCGNDSQCQTGEKCNQLNGACESGYSCGPGGGTGGGGGGGTGDRCIAIKAYDTNWREIDPNTLRDGSKVRFAVQASSSNFDRAQIRVHDGKIWNPDWQDTVDKKPGTNEFYIEVTIHADKTSRFEVQAKVHNKTLDQWF